MQELADAEFRLDQLHRGQRLGGIAVLGDVIGDVAVGAALDHLEVAAAAIGGAGGAGNRNRRLFEPVARAKDVAQAQDQENRDAG